MSNETRSNEDIFSIIAARKAVSDDVAAKAEAEAERHRQKMETEQKLFELAWTNVVMLVQDVRREANERLRELDVEILFGEQDFPRQPNLNWALYFSPRSQHLKSRWMANFIRHQDHTLQIRFKRADEITGDEEHSFKMDDFVKSDAAKILNRLLDLAVGRS